MSAKYTRVGQLEGKLGVPAREYLTARYFDGNFTYESRSTCLSIVTYFLGKNFHQNHVLQGILLQELQTVNSKFYKVVFQESLAVEWVQLQIFKYFWQCVFTS